MYYGMFCLVFFCGGKVVPIDILSYALLWGYNGLYRYAIVCCFTEAMWPL